MSSSARLKYNIVRITSEDPEYPAHELLSHSSQTKGWQTARFCDFPQELGLQFETPVHLRQVQFLSHQSKIASKIELFTHMPARGQERRYESVREGEWKRLGYLSLDSNELSQFQARELKNVYVDTHTNFLRILVHKCHVNRHNIVMQVGLIALNCVGEALGPDLASGPPPPNPALGQGLGPGRPGAPQPPSQQRAQEVAQLAADEMRCDPQTMERIRALTTAKQRAVGAEDYEEAKRLKEMLARLRQLGQTLADLEDKKQAAVLREDYDAAKALKVEIDRLRASIERPQIRSAGSDQGNSGLGGPRDGGPPSRRPSPSQRLTPIDGVSSDGRRDRLFDPPAASPASPPQAPSIGRLPPSAAAAAYPAPLAPGTSNSPVGHEPAPWQRPAVEPASESAPVPETPAGAGPGQLARTPIGAMDARFAPAAALPPELPPDPVNLERQGSNIDPAIHPLRGVPGFEGLDQPEQLRGDEKEANVLADLFGEYVTRCFFSKNWQLRDAALQKVKLDLDAGVYTADVSPVGVWRSIMTVLRRTLSDKNVQVFQSSSALLQAACRRLLVRGSGVDRAEVQGTLESIVPLITDRLGDTNTRAEKAATDVHIDLARSPGVGVSLMADYVLRPPKKKTQRVRISRLQLLTKFVAEFGIKSGGRDGIPLDETMKLAMEWFGEPQKDIRDEVVRLVGALYTIVGLRGVEPYMADLRQVQREVFDAEFERLSGGGMQPGGDVTTRKSPQRQAKEQPPAQDYELDGDEAPQEGEDATTCQFCGRQDPEFTAESLDVHYWRDCPMLMQCAYCQQIIEIATLQIHLAEECEGGEAARAAADTMAPNRCPLCQADVGDAGDEDWREHLLVQGCSKNPRNVAGG